MKLTPEQEVELTRRSTNRALAWLQSPEGTAALVLSNTEAPAFAQYHATLLGFTLGRYAHHLSTADLDRVDMDALCRALFGETTREQVLKRNAAKAGSTSSEAKTQAARENARKPRPNGRKPRQVKASD